jgi:hypothetical protein
MQKYSHFVSADCHFIDVKGTLQEELEVEITEIVQIKMKNRGVELTEGMLDGFKLLNVWEAKSKVIQGDEFIQPERLE